MPTADYEKKKLTKKRRNNIQLEPTNKYNRIGWLLTTHRIRKCHKFLIAKKSLISIISKH